MNKMFSTLMTMGLLMVGALFSNAQATAVITEKSGVYGASADVEVKDLSGYYFIGNTTDGFLEATEVTNDKGTKYTTVVGAEEPTGDLNKFLFKVEVATLGSVKKFQLRSKSTGNLVTLSTGKTAQADLDADGTGPGAAAVLSDGFDSDLLLINAFNLPENDKFVEGGVKFIPYHGGAKPCTQELKVGGSTDYEFSVEAANGGSSLALAAPAEMTKKAADLYTLNDNRNTLSFGVKDITSSLFGKSLKAFEVTVSTIQDEKGNYAPAGTYFATNYPEELAANKAITTLDEFQACDFIVVDPNTSLGTTDDRKAGKYMAFKEVAGADLVFGDTKGAEVAVKNAAFTVKTNMNQENGEGVYKFSISATFSFQPDADKTDHADATGVITSDKLDGAQTLTITKGAKASYIFLLSSGPVAKPINLLSKTGASVYNVLFLSGKTDVEKGKYLGVGITNSAFEFVAQGTAVTDLGTPQYQFVISAVDTEKNEITFTNRETKEAFTCVLDTTTTAGVYTIVSAKKAGAGTAADPAAAKAANLGTDGAYTFASFSMVGKTIQLIPATVDMCAGFSVRGTGIDQTFITFAKDENNADRLYVKAKYNASAMPSATVTQEDATDKESEAALFELVRSEKPVYVRSNYVYNLNDAVSTKTGGDTIAYYTYYIKYVNPDITGDQFYVKNNNLTLEAKATPDNSHAFILKENRDGSVSIIAAPTTGFMASTMKSVSYDDGTKKAIISAGAPYKNAAANDLKVFLVKEELGASLKATPAHVALEATTGGFISLSEKNEGIVAIKTAVSEDLTFWLDTADSKATLPAFYISKGISKVTKAADTDRLFMYYATDSATYYEKADTKNPYKWSNGDAKIIFKAATLANADTLVTTANGKTINVAVAADVNGTQAGLNNFRFQIFKADDAEDAYVVRNAGGKYLVSIANQLMLGDKKDALQLFVEEGQSPVDNEAVNASSISIGATNGAVIIKGAEGKTVTVSNVLGQTIASTVITSSEATISVPAGVVIVAVEGEAAVKAIVK
ncbi:DUF6383 domain-containing protein [Parabacteroides sp.]